MRSLPIVDHISYSQAASANRCSRQWWLRYVAGVLTPASPAMVHGKAVDELLTSWLQDTPYTPVSTPEDVLRDSMALWEVARHWRITSLQERHEGRIEGVKVPVIGFSDCILEDGTIVDWKCSRAWREDWVTQVSLYHLLRGTDGPCHVLRVYKGKVTLHEFEADVPMAEWYVRQAWETLSAERHPMSPGMQCAWCSVNEECRVMAALESTV